MKIRVEDKRTKNAIFHPFITLTIKGVSIKG